MTSENIGLVLLRPRLVLCALLAAGSLASALEPGHPEPLAARVMEIDLYLARINPDKASRGKSHGERPRAVLLWLPEEALAKCDGRKITKCGFDLWEFWNPLFDDGERYLSKQKSEKKEDHYLDPEKPPAPIAVHPWKKLHRHWNYGERYEKVVEKGEAKVDPELDEKLLRLAEKRGVDLEKAKTVDFTIRRGDTLRCKVLDVFWGDRYRPEHTFYLLSIEEGSEKGAEVRHKTGT